MKHYLTTRRIKGLWCGTVDLMHEAGEMVRWEGVDVGQGILFLRYSEQIKFMQAFFDCGGTASSTMGRRI